MNEGTDTGVEGKVVATTGTSSGIGHATRVAIFHSEPLSGVVER